jgi:hypothetical protein
MRKHSLTDRVDPTSLEGNDQMIEENEIEKRSCSLKATSLFPASSVSSRESLVIKKCLLQYKLDNVLAEQSEPSSISRHHL